MARLRRLVIHPFLWAVYPILMLVAYNVQSVTAWMVYRPLIVSVLGAGLFFGIFWLVLRNVQKAGLLVSLFILDFYSYGHVYGYFVNVEGFGSFLGSHRVLIPIWLLVLGVGTALILRSRRNLLNLTQTLNLVAVIALLFPLIQVISIRVDETTEPKDQVDSSSGLPLPPELSSLKPATGEDPPDIYYIILDGYGRDDTLKNYMKYDNSSFLASLQDMNFYVARCSQSNYSSTQLSLASSLNMDYLDSLGIDSSEANDQDPLNQLIYKNFTRRALKQLGYQVVVVESGFSPTEWDNADIFLAGETNPGRPNFLGGINPFESLVMRTSAGLLLYQVSSLLPLKVRAFLDEAYFKRRDRILYAFDALAKLPSEPGPKFVFAHILAPHEPFVFGPNGGIIDRRYPFSLNNDLETRDPVVYRKGYLGQVSYVNTRILPVLQKLIADSATPPIIIIQGDHGPLARVSSENGRMTILNAYYLPDNGERKIYPTITPVNTFRLIFNTYFGSNYPLLDDASFFFDKAQAVFRPSPNLRQDCQAPAPVN